MLPFLLCHLFLSLLSWPLTQVTQELVQSFCSPFAEWRWLSGAPDVLFSWEIKSSPKRVLHHWEGGPSDDIGSQTFWGLHQLIKLSNHGVHRSQSARLSQKCKIPTKHWCVALYFCKPSTWRLHVCALYWPAATGFGCSFWIATQTCISSS